MIIDLVRKNRSYRGYDHSRKVTEEELRSFVEAARLCQSSVNVQPLKYFLAFEEPVTGMIQSETKWEGVLKLDEHIKPMLIVAIGKPDEEIILTDVVDGRTGYYRDEDDRHYVPKRAIEDIIIM